MASLPSSAPVSTAPVAPGTPPLDRGAYPILQRRMGSAGDCPLVYLDSAATALVSRSVTDAYADFLHTSCANIHRGAHRLAEEATDAFECARESVARFFGVGDAARVVLTHGATESLNLAARGWAEGHLRRGDVVAVAEDSHHSNLVPWLSAAERAGAEVAWIPLNADGVLDYGVWSSIAECRPRLVALSSQSNVLGFRQPALDRIMHDARRAGAAVVLDGAQSAACDPIAFDRSDADFYACSAHKMGGVTGVGTLLCSSRVFEEMEPMLLGGGMAASVGRDGWSPLEGTAAFEAGTPPIAAVVAWSAALDELEAAGPARIAAHIGCLAQRARRGLSALPGVSVLGGGAPEPFRSLVSFTVKGLHPHDVGQALDAAGIMVRAGHHCAKPVHAALGVRASVRASFAGYSIEAEADALVEALGRAIDEKSVNEKGGRS